MTYWTAKYNWIHGLISLPYLKEYYRRGVITKEEYKEIKALPQQPPEWAKYLD